MSPNEGQDDRKADAGGVPPAPGGGRGALPGPADGNVGFAAAEEERPSLSYWQIVGAQFRKNRLATGSLAVLFVLYVIAVYAPLVSFRVPFVYVDGLRGDLAAGDRVEAGPLAFTVVAEPRAEGDRTVRDFHLDPGGGGARVRIQEGLTLGSGPSSALRDPGLEPMHARFGIHSGRPWVEDRSGKRGVKVNGKALGETTFPFFTALFNQLEFEMNVDRFFNLMMFALPVLLLGWLAWRRVALGRLRWTVRSARFAGAAGAVALLALGYAVIALAPLKTPYRDYQKELLEDGAKISGWGFRLSGEHRWGFFPPIARAYRDQNPALRLQGPLRAKPEADFLAPFREGAAPAPDPNAPKFRLLSRGYLAGTDTQGRDVFTRLLYGTRISLTIGVFAVAIYVMIGILFGGLAGYFGGWVDIFIMRIIEIMMCFPTFFLILTIISILESRSIFYIMVIIGITGWTGVARLVRGEFLKQRTIDYV
ncbi:MAG: ABC transporter permease, partial [Planctomycetes bacterium]|nr:ABC transporter permease [Planctomycetota bacterium]